MGRSKQASSSSSAILTADFKAEIEEMFHGSETVRWTG
jgi:hypothetical protein